MQFDIYQCPSCGAQINLNPFEPTCTCEYCGSRFHVDPQILRDISEQAYRQETARSITQQQNVNIMGNNIFRQRRHFWKVTLLVWIFLFFGCFIASDIFPVLGLDSLGASTLMFGLIYIIIGKPREKRYLGFNTLDDLQNYAAKDQRWKITALIWSGILIICWGTPSGFALKKVFEDIGVLVLLAGIPFMIITRVKRNKIST